VHIVTNESNITGVRNLLPARGGVEPETVEQTRRDAPQAFRTQGRAVTERDYADRAETYPLVQNAVGNFRWTGSWHTVFISVDRQDGLDITPTFENAMRAHVEPYRMAGHDLEIDGPRFVPLELEMTVCVKPNYFRSDVKRALLKIFQSGTTITGDKGLFHPDRYSFGQTVYLSPFYAAAQKIAGVRSVRITTFQRLYRPDPEPLTTGKLSMESLEIPRLDNDPSFPEHGVFRLQMEGGK
jgi:predicted phage baseplate assembly protein